jgi:hypothetical protein
MRWRYKVWIAVSVATFLAICLVAPSLYWHIRGTVSHEPFYQGRPTSYWSGAIQAWQKSQNTSAGPPFPYVDDIKAFLGIGQMPAVLNGDEAAVPVLLDLLKDDSELVRQAVASPLISCGPDEVLSALWSALWDGETALRDNEKEVREEAADALKRDK